MLVALYTEVLYEKEGIGKQSKANISLLRSDMSAEHGPPDTVAVNEGVSRGSRVRPCL